MSIRYLNVDFVQRRKGQSVIGAAAYRAGECLANITTGEIWDYTKKQDVLYTEIMSPAGSPSWVKDRQHLWNMVEQTEKRKDAQLAKNLLLALPHELGIPENIDLVRRFLRQECIAKGMIVDFAIHVPSFPDDPRNIHAHVLITTRKLEGEGFGKKEPAWNRKGVLFRWWREWTRMKEEALNPGQKPKPVLKKSFQF